MKKHFKDIRGTGKRRQYSPNTVRAIWERDKGVCVYCGAPAQSLDHVIPFVDNSPSVSSNLVCACTHCNNFRARHPDDVETLTKAIFWLLHCGEDVKWMDGFYK